MKGETTPNKLADDTREATVKDLLAKAQPGDLILVKHPGTAVSDGGHTRVVVANHMATDGTLELAQASFNAGEIHTEDASAFSGEDNLWILRPNRPLKPAVTPK